MNGRQLKVKISRLNRRWLLVSILIGLVVIFTVGDTGFYKQFALIQRKKQLEKKIAAETYRQMMLQKQIDSLQTNQKYLEKFVREQHKMGAEDEILFTVEP